MTNLQTVASIDINTILRQVEDEREQHEQPRKRVIGVWYSQQGSAFVLKDIDKRTATENAKVTVING